MIQLYLVCRKKINIKWNGIVFGDRCIFFLWSFVRLSSFLFIPFRQVSVNNMLWETAIAAAKVLVQVGLDIEHGTHLTCGPSFWTISNPLVVISIHGRSQKQFLFKSRSLYEKFGLKALWTSLISWAITRVKLGISKIEMQLRPRSPFVSSHSSNSA